MEINVDRKQMRTTVELDGREIDDPDVWKGLQPIIDEYRRAGYLFVIREIRKASEAVAK